jgi:Ca2+-binding EF-hand superfamily protein
MKTRQRLAIVALSAAVATPVFAQDASSGTARAREQQNRESQEEMRLRAMDTDNDGVITRAEWRGSDQSFREYDTNHDGVLSGEEVHARAGTLGRNNPDRSREQMYARFERADRNRDGRVARDEWTGSTAAFKRMDENGDGFVTRDEFSAITAERSVGTSGEAASRTTRAYQRGYDRGLTEGRQAGREDKSVNGGHWDLEGQRELEQADSGYAPDLGLRADYQAGYRAGFRLGYREGFGPRR